MDKETIEKVIKLTDELYKKKRVFNSLNEKSRWLNDEAVSPYQRVNTFLTDIRESFIRMDDEYIIKFFTAIAQCMEKEWDNVCRKYLTEIEDIEKELENL